MVMFVHIVLLLHFLTDASLCQVVNVAVGKPAKQYSNLNWSDFLWTADKAVDGCLRRDDPDEQGCCSCTWVDKPSQHPKNYWKVNLTRQYEVAKIKIYARERIGDNQLAGFELQIVKRSGGGSYKIESYNETDNIYTVTFSPPRQVTEVIIKRPGHDLITVCEVQVFAVCDDGKYGKNCSNNCGHCLGEAVCDKTTGACHPGCEAGFYGDKCLGSCGNCFDNQPCDTNNGYCNNGCASGWMGVMCTKLCESGKWGRSCTNDCSNCINDTVCDRVDGRCHVGCKAGWKGKRCDSECEGGKWGLNCENSCSNCINERICDYVDGRCPSGCKAGWKGVRCDTACESGKWGHQCKNTCSKCINQAVCSFVDGSCPSGCEAGWKGDRCDTVCESGKWGRSCTNDCSNCINDTVCDRVDGRCHVGCKAGWKGKKCDSACESGKWGHQCKNTCSKCINQAVCSSVDGSCPSGCEAGWKGDRCDTACETGKWGIDCRSNCYNCQNGTVCSSVNGSCPSVCEAGWKGERCDTECRDRTWGQNCKSICGNCDGNSSYHHVSGVCLIGCSAGWQGYHWFNECQDKTWGQNCSSTCGKCAGTSQCHHVSGECLTGCEDGWRGIRCNHANDRTDEGKGNSTALIAGLTGGILSIIVFVVLVVWVKRRYSGAKTTKGPNLENSFVPAVSTEADPSMTVKAEHKSSDKTVYENIRETAATYISLSDLREFCRKNCTKPSPLVDEFDTIPYGLQYETSAAVLAQNKKKNRYKDIYPYDKNRVHLPKDEDGLDQDYINASYVQGYGGNYVCIAAQGVMENTKNDFWWMVWSQNVFNIIMLTGCIEAGKRKCFQYWPDSGTRSYGNVAVTLQCERKYAEFIIRTLRCKYANDPLQRSITQFHYTSWPDKDVPEYPLSLVQFWKKVRLSDDTMKRPWLVHCSAGVGRTGTFIGLDWLFQQAEAEQKVSIYSCVKSLREQRVNMVQTVNQYLFLHQAVLEAVDHIGHPCTAANFTEFLASLQQRQYNCSATNMEAEFEKLNCDRCDSLVPKKGLLTCDDVYQNTFVERCADSKLPENRDKTRDRTVLPYDQYRPRLTTVIEGRNDYINAVLLQTYLRSAGLIITQTPLPHTVVDFLRLVWDTSSTTIVMMHGDQNFDNVGRYWEPEAEDLKLMKPFSVTVTSTLSEKSYSKTELQLSLRGEHRSIRQFQFNDWPEGHSIPKSNRSFLQLMDDVCRCHDDFTETPVVVHCMNGADRSGLFCVLWTVLERLKEEKEVAVAESVKTIRIRRPQIIPNRTQYKFCYDVVDEHLRSFELYANVM